MALVDGNGKPLNSSNGESNKAPQPGTPEDTGVSDIRAIPTGTLLYNAGLAMDSESKLGMAIMQMNYMQKMEKRVGRTPEHEDMIEKFGMIEHRRVTMYQELNERFHDFDLARCARLGLNMTEPTIKAPPAEQDEPS